ncbi:4342_t:CDS:2, partial [Racocetra persica]
EPVRGHFPTGIARVDRFAESSMSRLESGETPNTMMNITENLHLHFKNEMCDLIEEEYEINEHFTTNTVMYNVQGVIVTNIGFTEKAIMVVKEHEVILAMPNTLLNKLRFQIRNMIDNIDTEILLEVTEDEDEN